MPTNAPNFHAHARGLGIDLRADVARPWLTRNGHLNKEVRAKLPSDTIEALDAMFAALGGDPAALMAKTRGAMRADFLLTTSDLVVEYDEVQHFTTARLATLKLYPADAALHFDHSTYVTLTEQWRVRGDRGFAHKEAAKFPGPAGRQRQRAYFDAFRDLAAPSFDGPVIRIAAPDNNYALAASELLTVSNRL